MLPKAQNELITQTGPGTPMGNLIRHYWIPALLTEEIPDPDCPPVQVRILGEKLVAFRDTRGKIGLLNENCSHRGTSLFYGRNEECGLRCIYHGWKYDVEGNVVDTPAEPAGSEFKSKIRHPAYPTVEAAGIVFAYLGPRDKMPLFPNYEWAQLPTDHTYVTKCLQECNYLQGLEGECDSSHLSFLHRSFSQEGQRAFSAIDSAPKYEIEETDFGLRLIATRKAGPDQTYVRVSSFTTPISCWVPARNRETHIYVPADDTHSWRYDLGFFKDRAVRDDEVHRRKQIGPDYRRIRNLQNHYLQDREVQKTVSYTGIEDFLNHDSCATETMGPLYDRSKEHLGVSDTAVIAMRKYLLDSAKALQDGEEPPHIVRDPAKNNFGHVDTIAQVIPSNVPWREYFKHLTKTGQAMGSAAKNTQKEPSIVR
ncbi:MAG: Rieske 2Fe-2S domain-containing protein [Deltaproteobacteria bacterium]|nr:Rieske 2Fe-2S domain-containing protein [Deltaproteobacteria bacterium]